MKYIGCFFDFRDLHKILENYHRTPLYRTIPNPHITVVYRPAEIPKHLFGTEVTVKAVGYGCDGENEALLVEFSQLPQDLQVLTDAIAVPHITLSVSEHGESVNSRDLSFSPIQPFLLRGIFGGMDEDGKVHTQA